ncbi:secondary thiamine-phosphate synthase enzyme YjbQ [Actinoallomurus rhizosphaericola]|uniref:secondary thiamine-phosphate synthase enzyme YjbQ n=1 Tax=Actinoallomurus rhizosphaericola TaxID=2952536 RepID=UPI002091FADA|nr:secondary thiamine-phosphate synthase enzyme YjbQ [Actinoallomurus rhizosphaericola]MCO5997900.1 secondary thiamine-phosphate synthase enzyme YjbQ [Actinoallomurus rhizosphaericola]
MTVKHTTLTYETTRYQDYLLITSDVERAVAEAGVTEGIAYVISRHTTTGIGVNEALECLESDIHDMLERVVPDHHPYAHARMLHSYGSTAGNPVGHLRAHLTGNHCVFPVSAGRLVRGDAQDVYLFEFDGPSRRSVTVTVMGE